MSATGGAAVGAHRRTGARGVGASALFTLHADGTRRQRITKGINADDPSSAPGGRTIPFDANLVSKAASGAHVNVSDARSGTPVPRRYGEPRARPVAQLSAPQSSSATATSAAPSIDSSDLPAPAVSGQSCRQPAEPRARHAGSLARQARSQGAYESYRPPRSARTPPTRRAATANTRSVTRGRP